MRVLDRYLLRELLLGAGATALVLLVITTGGTLADVLDKVAGGSLPGHVMFPVLGLRVVDALTVLLPLALFLGVLLGLGRLYRDSEMHILSAAGMGPRGLLKPLALLALPLAAAVALVALWLGPLAVRTADALVTAANQSVIAAGLEPGRFVELPGHAGVIFVDSMSRDGTRLGTVFVESERGGGSDQPPRLDLITAARGALYQESDGSGRYLALFDGHRFEGRLGHDDWRLMRFARNDIAITSTQASGSDEDAVHAQPSTALLDARGIDAAAELAWRTAAPVSVLVLALLALPLARQTPREPRYGRLLIAIVVYLLFANLLALSRAGMVRGWLPAWIGLWWVELLAAAFAVLMLWRQFRTRTPAGAP
ncbi:MAG TPA: LPS export ABC transporter permease LptF [Rhodanobacteraceae bacterium]|nr:LPS export ABC transporter permease LptF [Rhodanobacteraceae bacterium]